MYLNWTPLRALVGAGSDGKIEIGIEQHDRQSKKEVKEHRALSGATETVLHRIDYEHVIRTIPTDDTTLQAKFREFEASVAAGETFTLDVYGTELSPDDPLTVRIIPNSYSETRQGIRHFSYSFRAREV